MRHTKAVLSVVLVALLAGSALAGEISPNLEKVLGATAPGTPVKVLVIMRTRVDIQALDLSLHDQRVDLATRHAVVMNTLQDAARASQQSLITSLNARRDRGEIVGYTPHWLVNGVLVTADEATIRDLATRDDVEVVEPNVVPELIEPVRRVPAKESGERSIGITPGVVNIGARRVWDELGIRGEGALIGSLDTGVDGNHPALSSRWRGNHASWQQCWHDVLGGNTQFPVDNNSHGTHTCGTMCGTAPNDTIGVAPGAEWIAANAIDQGVNSGFDGDIIDCFEWMTDPDGDPNTTDDVPDVVQNSWGVYEAFGYPDCDSRWWDVIDGCEAAGPVVVWAAGNEGSGASTLRSPADRATTLYNSFSVGATQHSAPYTIASFSSRGPAGPTCGPAENLVKPEVSAPGVSIYSSVPGNSYANYDGTSMACPHVAGTVALMRSANANVDVITIKQVLMDTAHDLGAPGEDNTYGHGFIDAYEAVLAVAGGLGYIDGVVTDQSTGSPISGAHVTVTGGFQTDLSGVDGSYHLVVPIGPATVNVSAFGYADASVGVTAIENDTVVADFALTPLPSVTVSGIVYLPGGNPGDGGTPAVGAAITVLNTPLATINTDAAGSYSLTLPLGVFDLHASAGTAGNLVQTVPFEQDMTLDLYLNALTAEDFETGDLTGLPWQLSGTANWFVQTQYKHSGTYAARSGDVSDNQYSQMQASVDCGAGGTMSFWYKVSSEATYDFLIFAVDGAEIASWSGEVDWSQFTYEVPAGVHTFRFTYDKDYSVSDGLDSGFVDDIVFPGAAPVPQIVVAPDPVMVEMAADAPTQLLISEYVFNMAGSSLDWSASTSAPWLDVSPASGSVSGGGYMDLTLVFSSSGLTPGHYSTSVSIASNDPADPTTVIPVDLLVTGQSTAVDGAPAAFALLGAMPNPFNPQTSIKFNLPASQQATLALFDVQGRHVRTLVDGVRPAGETTVRWDGKDQGGRAVASGTYFARLQAGAQSSVKTLTLVR